MMAFLKNNNSEKKRARETEQIASLTAPESDNRNVYEFVIDWNTALEIMGKSEFKEDYAPENAKDEINERVYQHLKKRSNNGFSKSCLDILLNEGESGYVPLREMLPSSLSVDEIYLYCFNKEVKPHVENINKIISYMKGAVEKREFYTGAILGFDAAIVSIDKLVADFNYKTVIENESETYNIAINFGINMLTAMTSLKAEELAKDETMNIYNCAREVMQKYAKKSNMEAEKILKLDKQFNQKIKSFKEWALKHQDELYNAAIEKAEALDRSHESLKDEFGSFSLTYSVILEEDRQSIQAALEKIDKTYSSAYATADESTKANFWEVQNTKNDKQ